MKKHLLCIFFTFLALTPFFSVDWGGVLENNTAYKGDMSDLGLNQTNSASLWLHAPVSTVTPAYIATNLTYEFDYENKEISHNIDASILKFNIEIQSDTLSKTVIDVGRFAARDLTGIILSQPVDGVQVRYENPLLVFSAMGGYTGFLNAITVEMNVAPNEIETSPIYSLAAPFALAQVSLAFPELFLEQTVFIDALTAIDTLEKDNRIYASAALNGPITPTLFYSATSTFGMRMQSDSSWYYSNLSTFEIFTFLPLSSLISWKTVFATGDDMAFETFTSADANIAENLGYAGNVKTGLVATIRPINELLFLANGDVFINVMDSTKEKGYSGAQWLFSARWEVASDLHLFATAGQYFSAEAGANPYFKGEFKFNFYF